MKLVNILEQCQTHSQFSVKPVAFFQQPFLVMKVGEMREENRGGQDAASKLQLHFLPSRQTF